MMFLRWGHSEPPPRRDRAAEPMLEISVVPDWDAMVQRADELARLVDQHLEYESALQGRDVTVRTLRREQRQSLARDLAFSTRS